MDDRAKLIARKVRSVMVHSFEADGTPGKGFLCQKKLHSDRIETETRSASTGGSLLTASFDAAGRLVRTYDTSELSSTLSRYTYDSAGRLTRIETDARSFDDDFNTTLSELHTYEYGADGAPVRLQVVKNGKEAFGVDLLTDAKGNVTDEIERKPGGRHIYYFYDDKGRLTDIVKMHPVLNKMLPDFTFDYDEDGLLNRMVVVDDGVSRNFVSWQYVNNEGLRIIEKCFSKDNVLMGYLEYEYEY